MTNTFGIETIGPKNIRFRSRLEAKWAMMFDRLSLEWDYEPVDLEYYLPDFMVYYKSESILVEIKGDVVEDFRVSACKVFRSGYNKDWIILGSRSPYWNEDSSRIEFQGYYVKCESVSGCEKQGWHPFGKYEMYYDRRRKLLWKVESDIIEIAKCMVCDTYVFSHHNICIFCKEDSTTADYNLKNLTRDWISFSNATQWKKGQENEELVVEPLKKKQRTIPEQNPYHPDNSEEFIESLKSQFFTKGEAMFCSSGVWDWDEMLRMLNESKSVYMSAESGDFCCGCHFVLVESIDYSKIN